MLEAARHTMAFCACAFLGCLLLASGSASAAPAWRAPVNLSQAGEDAQQPVVGVDRQGDAIAVWRRSDSTNTIVQATERPAGGSWQAPVDLSAPGHDAYDPELALDPQGDATVVWYRDIGSRDIVQAAERPAGGTWQAPVDLSNASQDSSAQWVAVDPRGDVTAVWESFDGSHVTVEAAVRPAATGVWQAPAAISAPGENAYGPRAALDAKGDATAVWYRYDGSNYIVQAAILPAGGMWSAPLDLSPSGIDAVVPEVAVDPQGDATAVWNRNDVVQAAMRPAGGSWQNPVDVSASGQIIEAPEVAVDPHGNATAIWDRSNGSKYVVQAATRPAGSGVWQTPADLSDAGDNSEAAEVAVDPQGNATGIWQSYDGTDQIVQAAVHPTDGTWQTPLTLSTASLDSENPQVAIDPQGDAAAVWDSYGGPDGVVQAAGYDAAGPQLRGLSIPVSGTAGMPVSFSVSPVDVWSPVASTSWSFGDGQTATDETVTHTFAHPGSYTVRVSSSDTLANATSTTANITIAPAPTTTTTTGPVSTKPPATPALTHVSQAHIRWREGAKQATIARDPKRVPVGTSFSFTINETARVSFVFTQTVSGRKVSGECQPPTRQDHKHLRCRRTITRATLIYTANAGAHRLGFEGQVKNRRLPLGAYTLELTATDTTTGRRSRSQTLRFAIVRAPTAETTARSDGET